MEKEQTRVVILRNFFGLLPGQKLQDFAKEIKGLTPADKIELSDLAAKELGVKIKE